MIKPIFNLNIGSLFKSKSTIKMTKLANGLPTSPQVKLKKLNKLDSFNFEEVRTFKNGTIVSNIYRTNDKYDQLQLIRKVVLPAKNQGKSRYEGGIEYQTIYTKTGDFWATLKSNCLNCDFTTYFKDPETGKMTSKTGLGEFNRKLKSLKYESLTDKH